MIKEVEEQTKWTLMIDGASCSKGAGVGIILQGPSDLEFRQAIQLHFPCSNNGAEYEALINGLQLALKLRPTLLKIFTDSQLVVGQVEGEFEV